MAKIWQKINSLILKFIKFYQFHFSPDHSYHAKLHPFGYCRFYPSCSEYAYRAISKYGLLKGGLKAFWRIVRCHPFNKGGYDPLK